MNPTFNRSNLPELRQFLDNLPMKPCPAKLPEEYCKMCRRLNAEVARFCETKKLPEKPAGEVLADEREPEREEEQPEEQRSLHTKTPILEKPTFKEGETSLEFNPSERSIEEARKSLPRFIPVQQGPRAFKPLEEPGSEEFELFSPDQPSIFKSPSALTEPEEMMFTLAADEGAIEVAPLEIASEATIASETIFKSEEGMVEAVEISDEPMSMDIEEEPAFFQFVEDEEEEIVDAEIVEAEVVEEGAGSFGFTPDEGLDEAGTALDELTEQQTEEEIPSAEIPEEITETALEEEPKKKGKKKLRLKKKKVQEEPSEPPQEITPAALPLEIEEEVPIEEPKKKSRRMKLKKKKVQEEPSEPPQEIAPAALPLEIEEEVPIEEPKKKGRRMKLKKKKGKKVEQIEQEPEPIMQQPQEEVLEEEPELILEEVVMPYEEVIPEAEDEIQIPQEEPISETIEESPAVTEEDAYEPVGEEMVVEGGTSDLFMCPACGSFVSSTASICIKCGFDFETQEEDQVQEEPREESQPYEEMPDESTELQSSEEVSFVGFQPDGLEELLREGEEEKPDEDTEIPKAKKLKIKRKKRKKLKMKKLKVKKSE